MEQMDNLPQAEGENKEAKDNALEQPQQDNAVKSDSNGVNEDSTTATEGLKATESESESKPKQEQEVPLKDYEKLTPEVLLGESENLLKAYPAHKLRTHFSKIRKSFLQQMDALEAKAKEAFVAEGNNAIDFYFENSTKQMFNKVYYEYRKQLDAYHKNLEQEEKNNLEKKLALVEELKALYTEPSESNNALFQNFRRIKTEWTQTGRIPKANVRNVNNSYYFHLDNFYKFLDLNQELRQLDYDQNLEVRKTILQRAEQLSKETNVQKALNELQYLHKLWKEEAVPVAEEHREVTWQKFKAFTQVIHDKKELLNEEERKKQEDNLKAKLAVIEEIRLYAELPEELPHGEWQKKIKIFESLREKFLGMGRVPRSKNQEVWNAFKEASRNFNRKKNKFYKSLKSEQGENLRKKEELVTIAQENKDTEEWKDGVNLYKKIQAEWKNIGHVPRKHSDRIWKEFKEACNHFFERYKNRNQKTNKKFEANLAKKKDLLEKIKEFQHSDKEKTLEFANQISLEWSQIGKVPRGNMGVNKDYNTALKGLLEKVDMSPEDIEKFKNEAVIRQISSTGDEDLLQNERRKLRSRIDEIEKELGQLDNNLNFFSNADESNPLLKDVFVKIQNKRSQLTEAEVLLRQLSSIRFDHEDEQEQGEED